MGTSKAQICGWATNWNQLITLIIGLIILIGINLVPQNSLGQTDLDELSLAIANEGYGYHKKLSEELAQKIGRYTQRNPEKLNDSLGALLPGLDNTSISVKERKEAAVQIISILLQYWPSRGKGQSSAPKMGEALLGHPILSSVLLEMDIEQISTSSLGLFLFTLNPSDFLDQFIDFDGLVEGGYIPQTYPHTRDKNYPGSELYAGTQEHFWIRLNSRPGDDRGPHNPYRIYWDTIHSFHSNALKSDLDRMYNAFISYDRANQWSENRERLRSHFLNVTPIHQLLSLMDQLAQGLTREKIDLETYLKAVEGIFVFVEKHRASQNSLVALNMRHYLDIIVSNLLSSSYNLPRDFSYANYLKEIGVLTRKNLLILDPVAQLKIAESWSEMAEISRIFYMGLEDMTHRYLPNANSISPRLLLTFENMQRTDKSTNSKIEFVNTISSTINEILEGGYERDLSKTSVNNLKGDGFLMTSLFSEIIERSRDTTNVWSSTPLPPFKLYRKVLKALSDESLYFLIGHLDIDLDSQRNSFSEPSSFAIQKLANIWYSEQTEESSLFMLRAFKAQFGYFNESDAKADKAGERHSNLNINGEITNEVIIKIMRKFMTAELYSGPVETKINEYIRVAKRLSSASQRLAMKIDIQGVEAEFLTRKQQFSETGNRVLELTAAERVQISCESYFLD